MIFSTPPEGLSTASSAHNKAANSGLPHQNPSSGPQRQMKTYSRKRPRAEGRATAIFARYEEDIDDNDSFVPVSAAVQPQSGRGANTQAKRQRRGSRVAGTTSSFQFQPQISQVRRRRSEVAGSRSIVHVQPQISQARADLLLERQAEDEAIMFDEIADLEFERRFKQLSFELQAKKETRLAALGSMTQTGYRRTSRSSKEDIEKGRLNKQFKIEENMLENEILQLQIDREDSWWNFHSQIKELSWMETLELKNIKQGELRNPDFQIWSPGALSTESGSCLYCDDDGCPGC